MVDDKGHDDKPPWKMDCDDSATTFPSSGPREAVYQMPASNLVQPPTPSVGSTTCVPMSAPAQAREYSSVDTGSLPAKGDTLIPYMEKIYRDAPRRGRKEVTPCLQEKEVEYKLTVKNELTALEVDSTTRLESRRAPGWNQDKCRIPTISSLFPEYMLDLSLANEECYDVLRRIPPFCNRMSIQAEYVDDPVSARLLTQDRIELSFQIFQSKDKQTVHVMVRRMRGDSLDANNYIRKLLAAIQAQEPGSDSVMQMASPPDTKDVDSLFRAFLEGLNRMESTPEANSAFSAQDSGDFVMSQAPQELLKHAIESAYDSLKSDRLNVRKAGLEMLLIYTSIERTMSSTSIPCAIIILTGKYPSGLRLHSSVQECNKQCQFLRDTVFGLLLDGNFQDGLAIFPESTNASLPAPYQVFLDEVRHLSLEIFTNAIEVVSRFEVKLQEVGKFEDLTNLFQNGVFPKEDGIEKRKWYAELIKSVDNCANHLAISALACKALFLAAKSWRWLRNRMLDNDQNESKIIHTAVEVGYAQHAALKNQSEALLNLLKQPDKA